LAKEARTSEEERLVLFLVDRTVARVPSTPPLFHVHYNRFLGATYGNKVSLRRQISVQPLIALQGGLFCVNQQQSFLQAFLDRQLHSICYLFTFCVSLLLQKLFQAVEEARAMLVDAPGSEQPLLTYPQPVKEDMRKSGRQLLQFLRQAAVEPAVSAT
jgi:hypothetical protein